MIRNFFRRLLSWFLPKPSEPSRRKVRYIEGDELPEQFPEFDLVVARERGDLWSAGMLCPCGCGRKLEVMLLAEVRPRWDLSIDSNGYPSLSPSVWVKDGCKSHFWLRRGNIMWCADADGSI